ncbi:MAG: hypothetical protein ISR60_08940 [Anaerolineales bacterium]|nr:hypothetical protein [Anaerolineales bacterium]
MKTAVAEAMETVSTELTETAQIVMLSATSTATATFTPSATATSTNTPTQTSTPTMPPTETPLPPGFIPENAILIYMVARDTGGVVGCGDSLIPLWSGHVRSGDLTTDLTIAINTLFRAGQYSGGLYNATYPSNLQVTQIIFDGKHTAIHMDGSYVVPADSCDASRYRSQVWATAMQFDEVTSNLTPWVRSKLLGDLLSIHTDGRPQGAGEGDEDE